MPTIDIMGIFALRQARPIMDTIGPLGQARPTMGPLGQARPTMGPLGHAGPTMDTIGPLGQARPTMEYGHYGSIRTG